MRDLITIFDDNGKKREVEVVTIYKMNNSSYNYIIYREMDGSHIYIAKYLGEEIVELNTNLTDEELKYAEVIYGGLDNVRG